MCIIMAASECWQQKSAQHYEANFLQLKNKLKKNWKEKVGNLFAVQQYNVYNVIVHETLVDF